MALLKQRLRKARQEHGMSTEDVAKLFNSKGDKITSRSILSYELGEREPSTLYIRGLINYLQVNPYWLLSNKGEMFDQESEVQDIPSNIDLSKLVFIPLTDMKLSAGYGAILQGRECVEDYVAFAAKWLEGITLTKPEYLMAFTCLDIHKVHTIILIRFKRSFPYYIQIIKSIYKFIVIIK